MKTTTKKTKTETILSKPDQPSPFLLRKDEQPAAVVAVASQEQPQEQNPNACPKTGEESVYSKAFALWHAYQDQANSALDTFLALGAALLILNEKHKDMKRDAFYGLLLKEVGIPRSTATLALRFVFKGKVFKDKNDKEGTLVDHKADIEAERQKRGGKLSIVDARDHLQKRTYDEAAAKKKAAAEAEAKAAAEALASSPANATSSPSSPEAALPVPNVTTGQAEGLLQPLPQQPSAAAVDGKLKGDAVILPQDDDNEADTSLEAFANLTAKVRKRKPGTYSFTLKPGESVLFICE